MARTAYNTDAKESYQSIKLPLYLPFQDGQYIKNGIPTRYQNKVTGKMEFAISPRWDIYSIGSPLTSTSTDDQSRGVFIWAQGTGSVYTVFGDILSDITANVNKSTTFTSDGGYVYGHFTEFFTGSAQLLLVKKTATGSKAYSITTGGVATEIAAGDADYPKATAIGAFVTVDGYVFVMTTDGKIYNSDLGSSTSWTSTNFLTAQMSSDAGIGLGKYKNQIVAFSTESIEFFYNAANPTGSPLSRTEQATILGLGAIDAKTIIDMEDTIYWVSANSSCGVYRFNNFKPEKISNSYIDQIIALQSSNHASFYAGKIIVQGRLCYYFSVANQSSAGVYTMIYDPLIEEWYIWTTSNAGTEYQWGLGTSDGLVPSSIRSDGHAIQTYIVSRGTGSALNYYIFSDASQSFTGDFTSASFPILFKINTNELDFDTHNFVRISKITTKIRSGTTPAPQPEITYRMNNFGQYANVILSIAQSTPAGALTLTLTSPITGTAVTRTIGSISQPTIREINIKYSIGEH